MSNNIPDGYHTATPYLVVKDAVAALAFYQQAFGAQERGRLAMPDGTIVHGEMTIGNSVIMFSEENQDMEMASPETIGGSATSIYLYVDSVDDVAQQAVQVGAILERPPEDQFWGDRTATLKDPFGHRWSLTMQVEDVEWDEVQRRFEEMFVTPS